MDPSSPSLTDAQEQVIAILPLFTALLSILGSAIIIRLTVRIGQLKTSYDRILFGLSIADLSSSTVNSLAAFLVPQSSSHRIWAVGNDATCRALGTLWQITTAGFMYSGMLTLYFVLTIRFGVTERTFSKYWEPAIHMMAVGGPLITGIIGLALNVYDEVRLGPGCWTVPTKTYGEAFGWIATAVPMAITMTGVIIGQIMIYRHCRQVLHRAAERSLHTAENKHERLKSIAWQSVSYVAVFLLVNLWPTIVRILDNQGVGTEASLYPLLVLQAIFLPIQGFGNCAIYVRPRFQRQRLRYPEESFWQSLKQVLWGNVATSTPFSLGINSRRRQSFLLRRSQSFDTSSVDGDQRNNTFAGIRVLRRSQSCQSLETV